MPVFDFNNSPEGSKDPVCTYNVFYSSESEASAEHPILVLDNSAGELKRLNLRERTGQSVRTSCRSMRAL